MEKPASCVSVLIENKSLFCVYYSALPSQPNTRINTTWSFSTRNRWKSLPKYVGGLVVLALLTLPGNHARADVDATKLENGVDEIVTEIQAELNVLPGFGIRITRQVCRYGDSTSSLARTWPAGILLGASSCSISQKRGSKILDRRDR